jgi:S-adenosylmethionine:tRNA ribosyltransferase-isomerase
VGNQKRWKSEELRQEFVHNGIVNELIISRIKSVDTYVQIEFRWNAEDCTFAQVLAHCGTMPLPPYLRRCAEHSDYEHYQTIYAQHEGSVAAPTSGLHFTEQVMNSLAFNNIATEKITLHVGAGTFLPVKTSTANDHIMHQERFNVRRPLLEKLQTYNDKIIAVGTTSARTLESLYWIGANLLLHKTFTPHLEQWQAYKMDDSVHRNDALNALYKYMIMNNLDHIECSTSLMIMPPYCYKIVNGLITNFHQPQSTLLLLVSAMVGAEWRRIYDYAMNHDFRFLSYGDSSLIFNIEQK